MAIGKVYESSASGIVVKMDFESFENNKVSLKIGKHLKISIGNHDKLIATIKNIKAITDIDKDKDKYLLTTEPVGAIINEKFISGSSILPSPTETVDIADEATLKLIFLQNEKYSFELGKVSQNENLSLFLDGDLFFSKHIGVVGSTGSGKSCTVAKILQEAVGINEAINQNATQQKNSHVIIFDIHSEYRSAFKLEENQNFLLNLLDVDKLKLPYWLMNSEELESLFIESNEANSHNQVSQFKKAVILNKEKYNPNLENITYDTPVYFSINDVCNYIKNLNNEVLSKISDEVGIPKIVREDGTKELVLDTSIYFQDELVFVSTSTSKADKASNGPFNGEFNRFISRLDNKVNDRRLNFIMNPQKEDGTDYATEDFNTILKQFLGYLQCSNVSIIDLSGIPFEVLSITISLISRIIFDFAFHYSKLRHAQGATNDVPFLIVCEEAHNYIPKNNSAEYKASKKSLERIAKEGRKYGLSLMVVSQRPSEVSDTIFAQCNNFISLRLTNTTDQSYVKNLLPNNTNSVADVLPTLSPGECLIVGDSVPVPTIAKMKLPNPRPQSENVKVHTVWKEDWKKIDEVGINNHTSIEEVLSRWRR